MDYSLLVGVVEVEYEVRSILGKVRGGSVYLPSLQTFRGSGRDPLKASQEVILIFIESCTVSGTQSIVIVIYRDFDKRSSSSDLAIM